MEDAQGGQDANGLEVPLVTVRKLVVSQMPDTQLDLEAAAVLAKATELFLDKLTERSMQAAASGGASAGTAARRGLGYDDVAAAVEAWDVCDFLKDVVPKRVTAAEAKQLRATMQRQQQERQQALAAQAGAAPAVSV